MPIFKTPVEYMNKLLVYFLRQSQILWSLYTSQMRCAQSEDIEMESGMESCSLCSYLCGTENLELDLLSLFLHQHAISMYTFMAEPSKKDDHPY
ncbi:hypothetical protein RHMOL_Rhmol06G0020600 [Rhododendron molle]|uniref:Uncharacterized protein n=1 Tax=Rhododendron molle TaxID=49168 RepID=A0ACC0N875_RHOML|nr:hypothetical protein RHMOL_Rhmol06G0020600 [Rhododendron molle]